MTTTKLDLFKQHNDEYISPRKPVLIKTKEATYLAIDGQGEPGGEVFNDRMEALYGMAFTIKMTRKFAGKGDYVVGKLEALWWSMDGQSDFSKLPKAKWQWKVMIRTPDFVSDQDLAEASKTLLKRGKTPSVANVKLETLNEGQCVQMLHVGPYDQECQSVALMQALAESKGLKFRGQHHEIYISDPRRVPPEKLKTILRIPVAAA